MRAFFVASLLCVVALGLATAASADSGLFDDPEFRCQACSAFCEEYETRIGHVKADVHPEVATGYAQGNASKWVWDAEHRVLSKEPRDNKGVAVGAIIRNVLETVVLSGDLTLRSVFAAFHSMAFAKTPVKLNRLFCREELCSRRRSVCPKAASPIEFASMERKFLESHNIARASHGEQHARDHPHDRERRVTEERRSMEPPPGRDDL